MLTPEIEYMQNANDRKTNILYETVSKIKQYSMFLNEEAKKQNQRLDDMENQMNKAEHLLKKTRKMNSKKWITVAFLLFFVWLFI